MASDHLNFRLTPEQAAFAAEHIKLAFHEAHRFSRRTGIAYEDLVGAAHIGLCKGARRFDPSKGFKPSTYLVSLIRGELLHFCRDRTWLMRISHRLREHWMKGRRFIPLGHSDQEIADKLGIDLTEWLECRHICSGPPVQLNDAVHEVTTPGAHGKPQLVEDDRTIFYRDAIEQAWEALPSEASALFWNVRGHLGNTEQRVAALSSLFDAAVEFLNGSELPTCATTPLVAASFGGEDGVVAYTFKDVELGNGRYQPPLF